MHLRIILVGFAAVCISHAVRADEPHSMRGCLARGATDGSYVLNDVEGVGRVAIPDGPAALDAHVGHQVEITGTSVDGADKEQHAMQVTSMKHLAASCP
jgi:hypothetical protein